MRTVAAVRRQRVLPQRRQFRSATLEHVVKELRKQGKLPGGEASGYQGTAAPASIERSSKATTLAGDGELIDIDAELLMDIPADFSATIQDEEIEYGREPDVRFTGLTAAEEESSNEALFDDEPISVSEDRSEQIFEDVSLLSEEELRDRVKRSIEELIPANLSSADASGRDASGSRARSNEGLTPAQLFFKENRESLVNRAQEYYLEKQREQQLQREAVEDVEDEWRFYHDPVVRPRKGHLWSTGTDVDGDEHGLEHDWLETVGAWPQGNLPTVDMLVSLLRQEQARDIQVVDLHACGRHDVGTHGIVATGVTTGHCRRLGEIVAKAVQYLKVPHVDAFCFGTRSDEWVVAHCGPIKVHLLTGQSREVYKLELLWQKPEEFFEPGDFPHYIEVYGAASQLAPEQGHITSPTGSRSTRPLPAPFPDRLNSELTLADYDAAEDAHYASPTRIGDRVQVAAVGTSSGATRDARSPGERTRGQDFLEMELLEDGSAVRATGRTTVREAWPTGPGTLDAEEDTDDEDEQLEDWPHTARSDKAATRQPTAELTSPGREAGALPLSERQETPVKNTSEPWDRL